MENGAKLVTAFLKIPVRNHEEAEQKRKELTEGDNALFQEGIEHIAKDGKRFIILYQYGVVR